MTESERSESYVSGTAELAIEGHRLKVEMTVPTGRTRPSQLLPLFNSVADAVAAVAASTYEDAGQKISCTKGCGACCRQLVPISGIEARRIRDLVNDMPEPRQSQIRARFAEARVRLGEAGILERLLDPSKIAPQTGTEFGIEYLGYGVPCPFLEDESCSIHEDRPTPCREYLVVSAPEHCAKPSRDTVRCVKMPVEVSTVIMRWDSPGSAYMMSWVPLTLALDWADAHPDETPPRPGPELVAEFFSRLSGKKLEAGTASARDAQEL